MLHAPRLSARVAASLAAAALAGAIVGCGKGGPPPREVVLYTSVDQHISEPVIAAFQRQSGIRVLARFDSEAAKTVGLAERIRSEAARPVADVFWSGEVFYTARLAEEGLLAPYESDETRDWPPALRDRQGRWHGFGLRARVLVYNTKRVPDAEAPGRLEDLLYPKWRGRIVMANPEFGTTSGHVASWFAHYGPDGARRILEGLKANTVRLVTGNSTVVRMVATGEADVGLTDTDDVYAGRRNGWPVAMTFLRHGQGGALVIPNTASLVKGGPHDAEARALAAFLLSPEVERILAQSDSHNAPVHPAVAAEFPAYACPECLPVDYGRVAEVMPEAIRAAVEILR